MKQVSKRNQRMRQSRLGALFISCLPVRKMAEWKNVTFFFTWREGVGGGEGRGKKEKMERTKDKRVSLGLRTSIVLSAPRLGYARLDSADVL